MRMQRKQRHIMEPGPAECVRARACVCVYLDDRRTHLAWRHNCTQTYIACCRPRAINYTMPGYDGQTTRKSTPEMHWMDEGEVSSGWTETIRLAKHDNRWWRRPAVQRTMSIVSVANELYPIHNAMFMHETAVAANTHHFRLIALSSRTHITLATN